MLTRVVLRVSVSSYLSMAICLSLIALKYDDTRLAYRRKTAVTTRFTRLGGMKYQVLHSGLRIS